MIVAEAFPTIEEAHIAILEYEEGRARFLALIRELRDAIAVALTVAPMDGVSPHYDAGWNDALGVVQAPLRRTLQ